MNIIIAISAALLLHYVCFLMSIRDGLKKVKKKQIHSTPRYKISVIIPFRNEAENLEQHYKSLMRQDYPAELLEVIYVDDGSTDNSAGLLHAQNLPGNVLMVNIPPEKSGSKKRAVAAGIKESTGEIIALTDADCTYPKQWLKNLTAKMSEDTALVAGPVLFEVRGGLFEKLQQLEFGGLVLAGAGLIGAKRPTIANAANIAFRRQVYEDVGGFSDNENISTGDDVFLLQKIAKDTKWKIAFCWNKEAAVATFPSRTFREFFRQRNRWASKGLFYREYLMVLQLVFVFLFFLSIPLLTVLGIIYDYHILIAPLLYTIIKAAVEYAVLSMGKKLFFKRISLSIFSLAEILHIPYILFSSIAGSFGNYLWKDKKQKR